MATLYVQLGQSDDALTLLEAEPGEEGANYHSDTDIAEFDPCTEVETRDKSLQVSTVIAYNHYVRSLYCPS